MAKRIISLDPADELLPEDIAALHSAATKALLEAAAYLHRASDAQNEVTTPAYNYAFTGIYATTEALRSLAAVSPF